MPDVEKWVSRINRLAREIDELAATIHPSAWPEALRELNEKWKKEAKKESPHGR